MMSIILLLPIPISTDRSTDRPCALDMYNTVRSFIHEPNTCVIRRLVFLNLGLLFGVLRLIVSPRLNIYPSQTFLIFNRFPLSSVSHFQPCMIFNCVSFSNVSSCPGCVLLCFIKPILGNRYGPGVNSFRQ